MTKLVLNDITNVNQVSAINDNFDRITEYIDDDVLSRANPTSSPNSMEVDLDMNGHRVYNLPEPVSSNEAARVQDVLDAVAGAKTAVLTSFTPTANFSSTNVQAAVVEAYDDAVALMASTAAPNQGAGAVGFLSSLAYAANTVGGVLNILLSWFGWQPLSAFSYMNAAQIADVQAGTLLQDVTVPLQNWATAGINKKMRAPAGKYKQTAPIIYGAGSTIEGDGIAATQFHTALDIEQVQGLNLAFSTQFKDIGWYNTFPVSTVAGPTPSGTTSSGSPTITAVSSVAGLYKGMAITGTGIPANSFIRKFTAAPNVIYLGDSTGAAVNATANGSPSLATFFRQGQTKFHAHPFNVGYWKFVNCYFKSMFTDTDFSPNNHAGVWFDRTGPNTQSFMNMVEDSWVDHGQVLMGTSDSDIVNTTIWGNPFLWALKRAAPNTRHVGGSVSAGSDCAVWITASGTEANGANLHLTSGVNIDGGDIWYTGYGMRIDQGTSVVVGGGTSINGCYKGGIIATDTTGLDVDVSYLNNNRDGLGYDDIVLISSTFQTTGQRIKGSYTRTNASVPTPGYAVREINSGFYPAGGSYCGSTISANYVNPAFLIVTPVASGQYPKIANNAGGGMDTESLPNATTNSYTGTLTQCTTAPTAAVTWTRQGNLITLSIPSLNAISANTNNPTITGMPASIWPLTQQGMPFMVQDNSATSVGFITISTAGVITINKASGAFTAANNKGSVGGAVTYQLVS